MTSDNIPCSTKRGTRSFFLLEMRGNPNERTVVRDIFIPLVYKQNMRVHLAFWNRICLRNMERHGFSNSGTSVKAVGPRSALAAIRMANDGCKKRFPRILKIIGLYGVLDISAIIFYVVTIFLQVIVNFGD